MKKTNLSIQTRLHAVFLETLFVVFIAFFVELALLFSADHFLIRDLQSRFSAAGAAFLGYLVLYILLLLAVMLSYRMIPVGLRKRTNPKYGTRAGAIFILSCLALVDYGARNIIASPFSVEALFWIGISIVLAVIVTGIAVGTSRSVSRRLPSRIRATSIVFLLFLTIIAILLPYTSHVDIPLPISDPSQHPNVILISLDTVRADAVSAYGCPLPTTPTIDRIADEGVIFENTYAQERWTLPSHATIFTSLYPPNHGAQTPDGIIGPDHLSLTQCLKKKGYLTCGLVDADEMGFMGSSRGFDRGFDYYEHYPENSSIKEAFLPYRILTDIRIFLIDGHAEDLVESAIRWIGLTTRHDPEQPFFLFLHFYDAHASWGSRWPLHRLPYQAHVAFLENSAGISKPPNTQFVRNGFSGAMYLKITNNALSNGSPVEELLSFEDRQLLQQLYHSAVSYIDGQIARLDSFLIHRNLRDNTLVVITSDHGEEFLEHGRFKHTQPYGEILHVPLIMRYPKGIEAGNRVSDIIQSMDIAPTILDICDIDIPPVFQGRSLVHHLYQHRAPNRIPDGKRMAFIANGADQIFGFRTHEISYLFHKKTHEREFQEELYDLREDPDEQHDVSRLATETLEKAQSVMHTWLLNIRQPDGNERIELDQRTREMLKGLGYMTE